MIVWINGTFGVGKTSTATRLVADDPRLRLFDPEWVGYLLVNNLADHPVTDFQHLPPWRTLTPIVADEVVRFTGQSLVAVQTVLVEEYWHEIVEGLARLGHDVVHVVLKADPDVVRRRIDSDKIETTARAWRHRHLDAYATARDWLIPAADLVVDTTRLSIPEAAATVRAFLTAN